MPKPDLLFRFIYFFKRVLTMCSVYVAKYEIHCGHLLNAEHCFEDQLECLCLASSTL